MSRRDNSISKDRSSDPTTMQQWRNDAEMALAAARDYPRATTGLVISVAVLAFLSGWMVRDSQPR